MGWSLTIAFGLVCVGLILFGIGRRDWIYTFPFLAGVTFLGFVGPQLPGLITDPFLPAGAIEKTLIFTILCAAMCGIGWRVGEHPMQGGRWVLDERKVVWLAAILSLLGAFFYFKLSRLPEEIRLSSMPTGLPVLYIFFGKILNYGMVLATLCFVRRPSLAAAFVVLVDSAFVLDRIMLTGKRGELTEFVLAVLLALWFERGHTVPRSLMFAAVMAATLGLSSADQYREISKDPRGIDFSKVAQIDVVSNFENVIKNGGPEMRNAVLRINSVDKSRAFDFGIFHWNMLVYTFVPAQFVGADFKEALAIPVLHQSDIDYMPEAGSTETGMADSFASFWYLGCLKFFLIAYVLARIYKAAVLGWALPQILYIFGITPALHAITHHTQLVVSSWVQMAFLLLPGLLLTRVRAPRARTTDVSAMAQIGRHA